MVINDITAAIPLAETLLEAGVNTVEITLRSENALKIIDLLRRTLPHLVVGAGTILTPSDFANASAAGAQYIISPGVTYKLLDYAKQRFDQVEYIPGVVTPSEALVCAEYDLIHLKFFPATAYNAYASIKALAGVCPKLKFCPTGGITVENFIQYLRVPNVFAIGMSSLVDSNLIVAHDFKEIKRRVSAAVHLVNQACRAIKE